ncbi:LOW QUALITY PROTEIN: hypothetical protein ACHAWF_004749 [Thalassiosira exigua]
MGVQWAVIGHSECRGKSKSEAEVVSKANKGLKAIACRREPLESRKAGTTNDFIFLQIKAYANAFLKDDWDNVVIVYDPIWVIRTGLTATTEQNTRILCDGSASSKTASGLSFKPDIDGFLVGGASLKPEFADIINFNIVTKSLKPVDQRLRLHQNGVVMCAAHNDPMVNIVTVNDPFVPLDYMEHMLQHDIVHGRFPDEVVASGKNKISRQARPRLWEDGPLQDLLANDSGVGYVIEFTGVFTVQEKAAKYKAWGAKKVVISAPLGDAPLFAVGVNYEYYDPSMDVVEEALMTTVHAAVGTHSSHPGAEREAHGDGVTGAHGKRECGRLDGAAKERHFLCQHVHEDQ